MPVSLLLRRSWQTFLGYWHQTFPSMEMHKHRIPASLALQHRYGRTADPSAVGVGANVCFQTQSKYVFSCFCLCIFRIKIFLLGSVTEKWTSYASVQKAQLREYSRCFGSFSVQLYCFKSLYKLFWKSCKVSDLFYLPCRFCEIYSSSCSPAVRAGLSEILAELFHLDLDLLCFIHATYWDLMLKPSVT